MDTVGYNIVKIYGLTETYIHIKELYSRYDAWAVAIGGFTPNTLQGLYHKRGGFQDRFYRIFSRVHTQPFGEIFIVAGLIYRYGPSIKTYIDKYFNVFTFVFIALLIIGFLVLGGVLI